MTNDLTTKGISSQVPAFMQEDSSMGTDALVNFIRPGRVKIKQKQAHEPLSSMFADGTLVMMPQMLKIADPGEPFFFAPLFFFVEWCSWNPLQLKGKENAIAARSFDINSDIARKARDAELRVEEHPDSTPKKPMFIKHVEHLNFIGNVLGSEYGELMLVLSFSRSEHKSGSNFATLIRMRKAPIFGSVFEGRSVHRPGNEQGDWWGIDMLNPSSESGVHPFIQDPALYQARKEDHILLRSKHEEGSIIVEHGDDDVESEPASDEF